MTRLLIELPPLKLTVEWQKRYQADRPSTPEAGGCFSCNLSRVSCDGWASVSSEHSILMVVWRLPSSILAETAWAKSVESGLLECPEKTDSSRVLLAELKVSMRFLITEAVLWRFTPRLGIDRIEAPQFATANQLEMLGCATTSRNSLAKWEAHAGRADSECVW